MEVPKISVIMPVYNAEETVSRMIDTIIAQTFIEWELICIDDGSKDFSGVILDEYAKRDERIRVIHKVNEGVSAARQDGLNAARGEYIIHADADDWVESTMLEEMYEKITKEDRDVLICDFYIDQGNTHIYKKQEPTKCFSSNILHDLFAHMHGSMCNKLVKRSCVEKYKVTFPQAINHCEDFLFWVQLFKNGDVKVSYIDRAYYHYCESDKSITRNYTRKTYEMRKAFLKRLSELLSSANFLKEIKTMGFNIFTEAFIYDVLSNKEIKYGLSEYQECIYDVKSIKWRIGFILMNYNLNYLAHKLIHY